MKSPIDVVQTARAAFESGRTKSLSFREKQLRNFLRMFEETEQEMLDALKMDLNKSVMESVLSEIVIVKNEIILLLDNLKQWAKPEKVEKGLANLLDNALIYKEPYGVVLVMGAWNYPIQVTLNPVAGAIAAGNTIIIKPSEISSATAEYMERTIPKYLDNECYQVMCGGVTETTDLLKEKFDYIFFTGSTTVGKIVHAAAARHLTPVTLELGGKSPLYLDDNADINVATRRILWGKCLNAGQTCVAPDYILCSKETEVKFVDKAREVLKEWYGENPENSPDYCRIISNNHFKRISKLLSSGKTALGGKTDAKDNYIEPTILVDLKSTDEIMQEEIFGPVLPVINVNNVFEAIKFVNQRDKPLALYIFSNSKSTINTFLENTSSGGVCVNDTVVHLTLPSLPFGGVGASGMGAYHGKYSFDTFVHRRSVLIKNLNKIGEKMMAVRYPPYSGKKLNFLKKILKPSKGIKILQPIGYVFVFSLGVVAYGLIQYIFRLLW